MSEERFDRIDQELRGVKTRLESHDARFDSLSSEMRAGFDAVNQRMGVLHESVLDKIAASTERDAVSRQEFREAIADLTEKFGRRIDPLT